tara:strand:- start:204 stop:368 length:165 start_codon:yes stop_codon:yes gene_type:complete
MNIEKYETENYFIFFDSGYIEKWVFVNTMLGELEVFESKKEAYNYLKEYHKRGD